MIACGSCGHPNPDEVVFCGDCGTKIQRFEQVDLDGAPDFIGQTLQNCYRVTHKVGQGGMGTVFAATDLRNSKQLALKVLLPELVAHPTARRRMKQEADALARIDHANVIQVYGVFDEGPLLVIAMELITGSDLSKWVRPGGIGESTALQLVSGMLRGLAAIHAIGLVHRDIKPDNVMLTADGVPKLMDLGVARDTNSPNKTQLGARLGTPEYMSPEQAQGYAVDIRSDLYSTGLVLYELLTGCKLIFGKSEIEFLAARVQKDADLWQLKGKCSAQTQDVLRAALMRDPAQRVQTADEFRRLLSATPIKSPPRAVLEPEMPVQRAARPAPQVVRPPVLPSPKSATSPLVWGFAGFAALVMVAIVLFAYRFATAPSGPTAPLAPVDVEKSPEAPPAVKPARVPDSPAAPELPAFEPNGTTCKWTGSNAEAGWLSPGESFTFDLLGANRGFSTATGTRRVQANQSQISLVGSNNLKITAHGKSLLTMKTWSPAADLEWVIGFWYDGVTVELTLTRIVSGDVATRYLTMQSKPVSDELQGHYLHLKKDARSSDHCTLRIGTDLGQLDRRGLSTKPYASLYMTLPHTAAEGWPTMLGGEWDAVGGLHD